MITLTEITADAREVQRELDPATIEPGYQISKIWHNTKMHLTDGQILLIKETPEQIKALIDGK